MNKRIILGTIASISLLSIPVAVNARNGADDAAGHIRQEDRRLGRQEDKTVTVPTTPGTTNATTNTPAGSVLSQTSSNDTTPTTDAATTLEEAIALAKAQFPNKTVKKTESEMEHGQLEYKVKFTDGSEVRINAVTGEITRLRDRATNENSRSGSSHNDDSDDDSDEDDHSGSSHN